MGLIRPFDVQPRAAGTQTRRSPVDLAVKADVTGRARGTMAIRKSLMTTTAVMIAQ